MEPDTDETNRIFNEIISNNSWEKPVISATSTAEPSAPERKRTSFLREHGWKILVSLWIAAPAVAMILSAVTVSSH